jgi:hypothetical protein
MNTWKQLYEAATPAQRKELVYTMLLYLEVSQFQPKPRHHFITAPPRSNKGRRLILSLFMFIMATLTLGIWLVFLHIAPVYGAPLFLFWNAVLFVMLFVKPYRRLIYSYWM